MPYPIFRGPVLAPDAVQTGKLGTVSYFWEKSNLPGNAGRAVSVSFLVVGDSSESSASWLASAGLSGTACSSGDRALELLGQRRFQAVFCNLRTSGMDGMELLSRIRSGFPEVAVVMVTEPQDLRYGILAMMSGASDFIQLPLQPSGVTASLARALKRKCFEHAFLKHGHTPDRCAVASEPAVRSSSLATA